MLDTIYRIKDGDHDAYREIVREYGPGIRVYLASRLTEVRAIDDLSQEIFIAAYWNLDRFDIEKDFGLWLRGIARNKLLAFLRKKYRKEQAVEKMRLAIEEQVQHDVDCFNSNEKEVLARLKSCVGKLPTDLREIVHSRYYTRESVTNLAERLKTTVSAISSKLYRIRKQLRSCVEGEVEL